jgi:hypothetical protein
MKKLNFRDHCVEFVDCWSSSKALTAQESAQLAQVIFEEWYNQYEKHFVTAERVRQIRLKCRRQWQRIQELENEVDARSSQTNE